MSETQEQKDFVVWFRDEYPQYAHCLRVSMSGINHGGGKRGAIMANYFRSQGVVDGEADIAILVQRNDFGSLVIEHKADDSEHKLTKEQIVYLELHNASGNCAISTRGIDALKSAVKSYLNQRGSDDT